MKYNGKFAAWAVALGLMVSMVAGGAMAQDKMTSGPAAGGPGGGGRGGRGGLYGVALGLTGITEEQKGKLEKGQTDSRAKMMELRKNNTGGGGPNAEMQKFQEDQKKDIEAILTDDQKKEFETKVAEMKAKWGAGRMGGATSGTQEKKE